MTLSARTLLSPEARARLAADPGLGGGNVLRSALAAAPEPDQPFLLSTRPVATCDGGSRDEVRGCIPSRSASPVPSAARRSRGRSASRVRSTSIGYGPICSSTSEAAPPSLGTTLGPGISPDPPTMKARSTRHEPVVKIAP